MKIHISPVIRSILFLTLASQLITASPLAPSSGTNLNNSRNLGHVQHKEMIPRVLDTKQFVAVDRKQDVVAMDAASKVTSRPQREITVMNNERMDGIQYDIDADGAEAEDDSGYDDDSEDEGEYDEDQDGIGGAMEAEDDKESELDTARIDNDEHETDHLSDEQTEIEAVNGDDQEEEDDELEQVDDLPMYPILQKRSKILEPANVLSKDTKDND
ncbi:hypothetical protein BGX34_002437 [Mortierella sp. NVP85]|nr:hypothetical protein BGX34_002437 [Mortierella sp. NVP85]